MNSVLYVFHGSQKDEKNKAAIAFVEQLKQQIGADIPQETAFLENHPHTILKQSELLIAQGADHIVVVPVLLFAAKHALVDIPAETAEVEQKHPKVRFTQAETFGHRQGSRMVLLERFATVKEENPSQEFTGILLAHGTKMTDEPQRLLEEIAVEIQEKVGFPIKAVSLKGQGDYLEEIRQTVAENRQPIIVPFFLFDGHLIHLMKKRVAEAFPEQTFIITPTLAFDQQILPDLKQIVEGAFHVSDHA
ncbi:sirohydrochlorin chelatase [Candidatus Enterococcus clewellii]|uniref:Cobalamin biosynthesis protein CbiX n=1 Tax=Candidatus Enterococcus clewellii TaxID=1834193 RepID=A0A242K6R3_9ENTE|nr:CbiX/SirB N-terminal domain-containing protein [Enterococcus sp. 9E7_DIV0242]OTP14606.1 hypothetical protein A5888_002707 [Enterococcus sp. 9E7_DIV0242]